jgi:hypothetical protein
LLATWTRQKRSQSLRHRAAVFPGSGRQRSGGLKVVDPTRYLIEAGQRSIDDLGAGSKRSMPYAVEQILGGMEHNAHGRQFDYASRPLERVKRTKHAIDPLRRHAVALQRDKIVRCPSDKLARFGNELVL